MSIEIEKRRFDITRDGAPYPPILRVDGNFETASQSRVGSDTRRAPDRNQIPRMQRPPSGGLFV
jgi:hypothetical protein